MKGSHSLALQDGGSAGALRSEIWEWRAGSRWQTRTDFLAAEEPLELRIRGKQFLTTMRTPGEDRELAAGLLFSEGVIIASSELIALEHCRRGTEHPENILNIFLRPGLEERLAGLARRGFISSSCGVCGKAAIEWT